MTSPAEAGVDCEEGGDMAALQVADNSKGDGLPLMLAGPEEVNPHSTPVKG